MLLVFAAAAFQPGGDLAGNRPEINRKSRTPPNSLGVQRARCD